MEENHWTCGAVFGALSRDGIGMVFDASAFSHAALIPPRTTLYACSWAAPRPERTEGQNGDGNHQGHHDTAH